MTTMRAPAGNGTSGAARFHEGALAGFSTLAILGAGLLAARAGSEHVSLLAIEIRPDRIAGLAAGILAAGLLLSLAHLGQIARAPRALARAGHSRLGTEVALAGATLAAAAVSALLPGSAPVTWTAAILALAFLAALGLVYSLPGQETWRGPAFLLPLSMGLAFGALCCRPSIVAMIIGADLVVFGARWLGVARLRAPATPAHPAFFQRRHWLLAARLLLVDVLPGALVSSGAPGAAAACLAAGILADRLSFYLLAAQRTTEAEMAAVEDLLARGWEPGPGSVRGPGGVERP